MEYQVEVHRSDRRTISLSIEKDFHVLVKAPLRMSKDEVGAFVEKHRRWIEKHIQLQREYQEKALKFTSAEVDTYKHQALAVVEDAIRIYAPTMGVAPTGVKITSAVTRWGSCSGRNSICFSYRIALLPHEAVDYIVVHELAHIRQKNHGPKFYAEVAKVLPDYRRRIELLKQAQLELGL